FTPGVPPYVGLDHRLRGRTSRVGQPISVLTVTRGVNKEGDAVVQQGGAAVPLFQRAEPAGTFSPCSLRSAALRSEPSFRHGSAHVRSLCLERPSYVEIVSFTVAALIRSQRRGDARTSALRVVAEAAREVAPGTENQRCDLLVDPVLGQAIRRAGDGEAADD